ncbi:hypothetical protein ABE36_03385 [Bacillus subtilis]|nr:hypothetical protein AWV81_03145 [Bacillus subtilis subsp. natto]API94792.1 hypothetical protein BKP58_02255 [Bacillus subtilis]MBG9560262.1 hypothetical protein [Bacillus subtilis]
MIDGLKNDLIKNVLEDGCIFKACASVPADGGVVWNRVVYVQSEKPSVRHIVVNFFFKLSF